MEGNRKLLTTLVFGLLSLAALALILLLKQFTPEVFKVWITGTASVFGVYQVANVVTKFSPNPTVVPDTLKKQEEAKKESKEKGGRGLFGISGRLADAAKKRKEKKNG